MNVSFRYARQIDYYDTNISSREQVSDKVTRQRYAFLQTQVPSPHLNLTPVIPRV
jgi:hypothetical protein